MQNNHENQNKEIETEIDLITFVITIIKAKQILYRFMWSSFIIMFMFSLFSIIKIKTTEKDIFYRTTISFVFRDTAQNVSNQNNPLYALQFLNNPVILAKSLQKAKIKELAGYDLSSDNMKFENVLFFIKKVMIDNHDLYTDEKLKEKDMIYKAENKDGFIKVFIVANSLEEGKIFISDLIEQLRQNLESKTEIEVNALINIYEKMKIFDKSSPSFDANFSQISAKYFAAKIFTNGDRQIISKIGEQYTEENVFKTGSEEWKSFIINIIIKNLIIFISFVFIGIIYIYIKEFMLYLKNNYLNKF